MNLSDTLEYSVKFVYNLKLFWKNRPISMANDEMLKIIKDISYVERKKENSL